MTLQYSKGMRKRFDEKSDSKSLDAIAVDFNLILDQLFECRHSVPENNALGQPISHREK